MRILTRYILRAHVGPFLFALSALTSILMINAIARQLENLAGKGLPTSVFVNVIVYSLPHVVALTIPMAVLVAVLYTFSQLSADNEITALKASGVNLHRLLLPALAGGVLVAVLMVVFYDRVLPEANHRLANLFNDVARKAPTLQLREQVINEIATTNQSAKYYLQAATIDPASNRMHDVVIYDMSHPQRSRTVYADSGRMAFNRERTNLFLDLYAGWVDELDTAQPERFTRLFFHQYMLAMKGVDNQFDQTRESYRSDREMTLAMLGANVRAKRKELASVVQGAQQEVTRALKQTLAGAGVPGGPKPVLLPPTEGLAPDLLARRYRAGDEMVRQTALALRVSRDRLAALDDQQNSFLVEYYKKFAIPFASIVFVLIGAPLALRFPRGGTGTVIAISLAIFSIYYVGLIGGETLSDKNLLSPFLAMWTANIVFLLASVYGVATLGHERASIRDGTWADAFLALRESALRPLHALRERRRGGRER